MRELITVILRKTKTKVYVLIDENDEVVRWYDASLIAMQSDNYKNMGRRNLLSQIKKLGGIKNVR